MVRHIGMTLLPCSIIVLAAGCGSGDDKWLEKRPETYSAGGKITYNGDPVEGATVIFKPTEHSHGAVGTTNAEGIYQLRTFEPNDGAAAGTYNVGIRKVEVKSAGMDGPPNVDNPKSPPPEETSLIPKKYGNPESSAFTAKVTEDGENQFDFQLKN